MATYTQNAQRDTLPAGKWAVKVIRGKFIAESVSDKERLKKMGFTSEQITDADGEITVERLTLYMELRGIGDENHGEERSGTTSLQFQPNLGWKIDQARKAFGEELEGSTEVEIEEDHFDGGEANILVVHKPGKKDGKTFVDITWLAAEEPF